MIELGYSFLKKDLNKIRRFRNPTLDIHKDRIKKNSNFKIFLNKNQYNNLIENKNIKYKLTDSRKQKHLMRGDGIGALLTTAFNMIKPALPKIASTIGLAGLSTGISHGINKALKKDTIIKLNEKQVNDINKNLKKINDSKIFNKKLVLGNGLFSILLPLIASTIIPALIPKKDSSISEKNIFFERIRNKYAELFNKKNYPLSNIFINNLLKDEESYLSTFSKDDIPLIKNNKSIIFNLHNSNQPGSHWIALVRNNNNIYIFDSFGIGHIPKNIYDIYKDFNIITNIYRIQHINSNLCGLFCVLFCLYKVNNKNKFIEFLNMFNVNNYIKNELV